MHKNIQKQDVGIQGEASKMLEDALQQMDGIIISHTATTGTSSNNNNNTSAKQVKSSKENIIIIKAAPLGVATTTKTKSIPSPMSGVAGATIKASPTGSTDGNSADDDEGDDVRVLSKRLAKALQRFGYTSLGPPDGNTATIIQDWLDHHLPRPTTDERLLQYQKDKEALILQNQMLTQRLSEQVDKIIELEGCLTEKTQQLNEQDVELKQQKLTHSKLHTQRLELITALTELKLYSAALECGAGEEKLYNGKAVPLQQKLLPPIFGSTGNLITAVGGNQSGDGINNNNNGAASAGGGVDPKLNAQTESGAPSKLLQFNSLPRIRYSKSPPIPNRKHHNFDANANNSRDVGGGSLKSASHNKRNVAFASTEKVLIEDNYPHDYHSMDGPEEELLPSSTNSTPTLNMRERSLKNFCNILGMMRRTNSGNSLQYTLNEKDPQQQLPPFKRGGARATAGGRLEWSTNNSTTTPQPNSLEQQIQPSAETSAGLDLGNYQEWSLTMFGQWLSALGLSCYQDNLKKWLKPLEQSNQVSQKFFQASPQELEKELAFKSPLHRKKLLLAMNAILQRETDELTLKAARLDSHWVIRWLDDIGLPQYKDVFSIYKIDGSMLHRLTYEDLAYLQITSCLHIASLRRGIQLMREMSWHPECLIRRSNRPTQKQKSKDQLAGVDGDEQDLEIVDKDDVALWTAHRVMEWLRVVDLSEYAPNLRGAGVHGALMLYETRFNSNLLADLLCIPPSKTLLRRHLATHFKELLGRPTIQAKRDAEQAPDYQPLSISAKIKPLKQRIFSLKLRNKPVKDASHEVEWSEFVCPMGTETSGMQKRDAL